MREERGFTLVEVMISMAIVSLLIVAIGSALLVSFRTTGVTNARLSESHDVQIESSYLANDMQSSKKISVASASTDCSGASTTLVTFIYFDPSNPAADGPPAVYACGKGTDGETQVTRSFGGSTQILAHFAGIARPTVTCSPSPCTSSADAVTLAFTEASGLSYSLVGARRIYTSGGAGSFPPPQPPLTLLASGSSPLYVQGGCKSGGANANCIPEGGVTTNSLPLSDVQTTGWTTTPLSPQLSDELDSTWVTNNLGVQAEAQVLMAPVPAPTGTPTVTISVRAMVAHFVPGSGGGGPEKLTLSLYQVKNGGGTTTVASNAFQISETDITDYSYVLKNNEVNKITDYSKLRLGFAMTQGVAGENINVYGAALDTTPLSDTSSLGNPVLTINGYLHVNSTLSNAVRLTGTKTATKLKIAYTGPDSPFDILYSGSTFGACSGCFINKTVDCSACRTTSTPDCSLCSPTHMWTSYSPAIPDPLRFMGAPTDAGVGTTSTCPNGATRYNPGVYTSQLLINSGVTACLDGGIYILKAGMKVNGGATVVGQQVLLYNDYGPTEGGITFNGGSNVQLTAYNSSPFPGVLIYQARCPGSNPTGCSNYNDKPINLTGGTVINGAPGVQATFLGVIYAPASTDVTLGSGGANMRVSAVIAQNLTVTGTSFVTIG